MSSAVFVPVFDPAVFSRLGDRSALQRCLDTLDEVRGVERVVCFCLKTGFDDTRRIAAAARVARVEVEVVAPTLLPDLKPAIAAAAPTQDTIAIRDPVAPFLRASTVEMCLDQVDYPGRQCWTAAAADTLEIVQGSGAIVVPRLHLIPGVWAAARAPGTFQAATVAVGTVERLQIDDAEGLLMAQILADSGTV